MVGRPFPPGVSGNPKGRPKRALFDDSLKDILNEKNALKARACADALVQKALGGDVQALRLVAERVNGKPPSAEQVQQAQQVNQTQPASREAQRAKLLELLRSPELRSLLAEAYGKSETERVQ